MNAAKRVLANAGHLDVFNSVLGTRSFHISQKRLKAKIIDGVKIARDIRTELKVEVEKWVAEGNRHPHLAAILVGQDPASKSYVSSKMKAAKEVGITTSTIALADTVTEQELLDHIQQLNEDVAVDGILVQLPLPEHITERAICNAVAPHKDVDGFNIVNVGRFCLDMKTLIPCTPLGVQELIKRSGVETFGKNAVVCGRSKNVGMPIAMLLHADGQGETSAMDATTTICHRYTPPSQLATLTKHADIIVSAAGVPNLIRANMVKKGCCVIDVGITRIKDAKTGKSKLVGDVDYEAVSEVAGHITPVPGGVGPMTVAMLMKNTVIAAKKTVVYNILDPGAVVQKKASQLRP
ncbi:bifunctional methylenetetrahydrofolate dehydrogenase/cyclohydrolase, mitochondrial [Schistocerca nitens]|uniref:bifunctional methylenetetrahydrofolate dehydrogenase/cyclohydrolase, mitochondrial n=1 Tax=Schistocerca nitens TaxID=7011 RepID=UPI002118FEAB|nr:bifunctional methylenetetrahydrofolate dehydrogenase/cyclohydrolase, mitochondrial [Schistocerca nitens]